MSKSGLQMISVEELKFFFFFFFDNCQSGN